MGYSGTKKFTIINERNEDVTNFRLTHFMNGEGNEKKNKVVTKDVFKSDDRFESTFESVSGKDDHWFVQFETLVGGCKMTNALVANMAKDKDEFKIRITIDEMKVEWKKGTKFDSKGKEIKRVSQVMD